MLGEFMMKIIFLDRSTIGKDIDTGCLEQWGDVIYHDTTAVDEVTERVKDADIVITNKVPINKSIMIESRLQLICVAATGMNNIDLEAAKEAGIAVKNVAGYSTDSVVQMTFSMLFYLLGKMRFYDDFTESGQWSESAIFTNLERPFREVSGMTWGIIGLGDIGQEVAQKASCFGAQVLYYSTSGRNRNSLYQRASLKDLLQKSDIISIHAPLNEQTYNLINKDNLNLLKKESILLNLGRGGIINEEDLAHYLDNSDILAGLDVLEKEPMSRENPLHHVRDKERLFITPHIAWASVESRRKLLDGICQNIKTFLGEKL